MALLRHSARIVVMTALAWFSQQAARSLVATPAGVPIDEAYRAEFDHCDQTDVFHGVRRLPPHACRTDPSRLTRLVRVPAVAGRPEAILFEAKLAWDRDGSGDVCSAPGHTSVCATSLMLAPTAATPCPPGAGSKPPCVPVDADRIAYIAIPAAGPSSIKPREFRDKTGIGWGDYGVVLYAGRTVPVIVADGGTVNKIGEGSTALLRALSSDGKPHAIGSGVTFIVFPRSATRLSVSTIDHEVRAHGAALYNQLVR